ncbi:MAG: baseplate J/gp47 family protein [Anaerolineae bacterium]|nr:baseplate J/gp47 family protein [Anaerolineae bacterium]
MNVITITPEDNRYTIREALQAYHQEPVLVILTWEITKGWSLPLDYEILLRESVERQLNTAFVIEDPEKRHIARKAGFQVFRSEDQARAYFTAKGAFAAVKEPSIPLRPKTPWYAPLPKKPKKPRFTNQPVWMLLLESIVLLGVVFTVLVTAFLAIPSAEIILYPENYSYSRVVQVSVDPQTEIVNLQQGVIPAIRIGDEFNGYAEVATTGRGFAFSGTAEGRVLFTNLLGQEYRVPANTVVRTSSGSFPVRYATTQDAIIPAFGQAEAPVIALEDGPRGNVDAYQVNLVEGVVGFAVRVTNPSPITGAESTTVNIVAEDDRTRVWAAATEQVLAIAYNGLQELAAAEPGRFLPNQTLVIQASPKVAYTHVVGEQTDILGLSLNLLITGYAVDVADTQAVALRELSEQLPDNASLTDARFEYGEAAEEEVGGGAFSFYVTAYGYSTAHISTSQVEKLILGKPIEDAVSVMQNTLPLSRAPEVTVSPEWFTYIPRLPIRVNIAVIPGKMSP